DRDQAERNGPDGVDPAGIAGSLLHQDIETFQNTLRSEPGFRTRFHQRLPEMPASPLFSPARCAILVPQPRLSQRMTQANALRSCLPLRYGDRTEQTILAPDFPGADAG